ncbi:MAG TPA: DUF3566 domain-containing protein [Actinomycetospora sp.]
MSTATPDEDDARDSEQAGTAAGKNAGGDTAADTVATTPASSGDETARGSEQAASAGGPPPPWQRAGSRSEGGARPAEGDHRPSPRPATGPLPTAGGEQRTGTPAAGVPRPSPQGPPPSGPIPTGQRPSPPSGPMPAQGERRSNTALIDAPTNQLSPEQLGMRTGGRNPEPEPDLDDIEDDVRSARPSRGKVPRRASLQVKRFDPWSVLKLALVLGVALFFVWMFAVGVLYAVLDGMGVWAQLNGTYQDLTSDTGGAGQLITAGGVFGIAAIVGVVNTILFTALASVSAFIYNISADVAGGIEVTLSERD